MRALKAFLLGAFAVGVARLRRWRRRSRSRRRPAGARSTSRSGRSLLVAVRTRRSETATTFGPGLVALALLGGLANLAAAAWLMRRVPARRSDRVD